MLMAEDSSNWNALPAVDGFSAEDFDGEDMSIDIDTFYHLLEEDPPGPGDSLLGNTLQAEAVSSAGYHEYTQLQSGPGSWHPPYSSEVSDSGQGVQVIPLILQGTLQCSLTTKISHHQHTLALLAHGIPYFSEASDSVAGGSGGSFGSGGNPAMAFDYKDRKPPVHTGSPGHAYSTSLKEWFSLVPCKETCFTEWVGVSQPTCSTTSSFAEGHTNLILDHRNLNVLQGKADVAGNVDSEYSSQCLGIDNMGMSSRTYGAVGEYTTETLGPSENNSCTSMEMPFLDKCSLNVTSLLLPSLLPVKILIFSVTIIQLSMG